VARQGVALQDDAYLFSNDPAHSRPWNPDWATHKVAEAAAAAEVELDIKRGRHYTASQLLAGGFDLRYVQCRPQLTTAATLLTHGCFRFFR
jgi:integrase